MVTKIYQSREDLIAKLNSEDQRVQWDAPEADEVRINDVLEAVLENVGKLDDKTTDYMDAIFEDDEDSAAHIGYSRREMIEAWALAQAALSKLAWVIRIDGNDAYQRMITALQTGEAVDMQGL